MRPLLVGITGGVASGKVVILVESKISKENLCNYSVKLTIPSTDCVILHGLTVFEDTFISDRLDLKIYIDVDSDLRLIRMLQDSPYSPPCRVAQRYADEMRSFHIGRVMKQKKLADFWIDGQITNEKVEQVANLVINARNRKDEREPDEIHVYLENYSLVKGRNR
uniref:PRK domain-containing protein n=1 Tax=Heterorhabditis bacteriophora TaxID=37862 RepID=A0A1I7X873_HETBA